MKSIFCIIASAMLLSVVIGQTITPPTAIFTAPTAFNPSINGVSAHSNGYVISLTGPGWIYGNPIGLVPTGQAIIWATILQNTGVTGVGLIAANCPVPWTSATNLAPSFITSNIPSDRTIVTPEVASCPVDFATIYTAVTPQGESLSDLGSSAATIGNPLRWTITQPQFTTTIPSVGATPLDNAIGIEFTNDNVATTPNPSTTASLGAVVSPAPTATRSQTIATSTREYSLYAETTGTARVCVQSNGQYAVSPGNCGEALIIVGRGAQSASVLSTAFGTFAALIALVFFH